MSATIDLTGKVAVVTGGTSGIGRAIAARFVASGADVVLSSRSQARADATATELSQGGARVIGFGGDVSSATAAEELVGTAVEAFGTLDVLVNNAGVTQVAASDTLDPADWQRVIDINLTGPFLCAQAAGRVLLAKGDGVILNISSILGHTGLPGRAAYCSAKHGMEGMTKVLAAEWAARGVRVLALAPGYVATPLVAGNIERGAYDADAITGRAPNGRFATPEEIADVAAFLVSSSASYMVGASVVADGGWLAYGGWTPVASTIPEAR